VADARHFDFTRHDGTAYVIARIEADPTGPVDRMYKIGGKSNGEMQRYFYVVVRGYDASDPSEPDDIDIVGPSRRISRWAVYGIELGGGRPTLREISSGDVRWCGHPHTSLAEQNRADIMYCNTQGTAAPTSAQRQPLLLQTVSQGASFRDPPLWFTCGLGCCVADVM
jgi:hypothetical protein